MKSPLAVIIALSLTLSAGVPAFAQSAPMNDRAKIGTLVLEIDSSNQEIDNINKQIDRARSLRKTTLWVGIPVTIGAGALGLLASFAEMMSTTGIDAQSHSMATKSFAVAGVVAVGSGYMFHVKGKQIDDLQTILKTAKKRNLRAKAALLALGDE